MDGWTDGQLVGWMENGNMVDEWTDGWMEAFSGSDTLWWIWTLVQRTWTLVQYWPLNKT